MSQDQVKQNQEQVPEILRLLVKGRIPSKKNSRNIFIRGGRQINIPSKEYSIWHKVASIQLESAPKQKIKQAVIKLSFFAPDRRSADLTNKAESIMDLLVDNEILDDDNWWVVGKVILEFKGVDKAEPRCQIDIYTGKSSNNESK